MNAKTPPNDLLKNDLAFLVVNAERLSDFDALDRSKLTPKDLQNAASAIAVRLHRGVGDEGIEWCLKTVAQIHPGLRLNDQGDTVMIKIAQSWSENKIRHYEAILKPLMETPETLFLTNNEGKNALLMAASEQKMDLVKTLMELGAKLDHFDLQDQSVIELLQKSRHIEALFEWMKEIGAVEHILLKPRWKNIFYQALARENMEMVERMKTHLGPYEDLFLKAIREENMMVVQQLIELGVDLHKPYTHQEDTLSWSGWARKFKRGQILGLIELAQHRSQKTL